MLRVRQVAVERLLVAELRYQRNIFIAGLAKPSVPGKTIAKDTVDIACDGVERLEEFIDAARGDLVFEAEQNDVFDHGMHLA